MRGEREKGRVRRELGVEREKTVYGVREEKEGENVKGEMR